MGIFYIYSLENAEDLYNSITFTSPGYSYISPDDIYDLTKLEVYCKPYMSDNFWEKVVCVELLPKSMNIYSGIFFSYKREMDWNAAQEWLDEKGYTRAKNFILNESFSTVSDASDGVTYFCDTVAKTKATQYLLMGYK